MKIAQLEERLIQGECTAEVIELFKTALKRVPSQNRCQHCYTTAVAMSRSFHKEALGLIEYGLQFDSGVTDRIRAYHNCAVIFEEIKDFENARKTYIKAMDIACEKTKNSNVYLLEYSFHLMRVQMHISNFCYTDELKKYYELTLQADSFSRSFMKNAFYEAVAEIIIFMHTKNYNEAKKAYVNACEMLSSEHIGPLTKMLKKHKYKESAGATEEAIQFLKNLSL